MGSEFQTEVLQTLSPLVEQYEFECLLSSRNAEQRKHPVLQAQPVGNYNRS